MTSEMHRTRAMAVLAMAALVMTDAYCVAAEPAKTGAANTRAAATDSTVQETTAEQRTAGHEVQAVLLVVGAGGHRLDRVLGHRPGADPRTLVRLGRRGGQFRPDPQADQGAVVQSGPESVAGHVSEIEGPPVAG